MSEEVTPLVDVAIPLPLAGVFTYRAPDAFKNRVQVGRRVIVPFRKKICAGFVVDYPSSSNPGGEIKEITDVPEEEPYLTRNLWSFLKWIADYYLLPVGLVLKTALPPGSERRSQPWALFTPEGRKWFAALQAASENPVRDRVLRTGTISCKDLAKVVGKEGLDEAQRRQWIRVEERIARPRTKVRSNHIPELLNPLGTEWPSSENPPDLTPHQQEAFRQIDEALQAGGFHPFLLFGVTGSGKTEVYLRAIARAREHGKTSLVLVPEIALTPQLARRFLRRLGGGIALFHSGLTRAQRLDEWRRISSGKVNVVIAARSGIFVPLENLGLIVVDEEHDPSYKQEDSCPYNAKDMALVRGKLEGATVILGSATPSFETFVNAQRGRITRLDLPVRSHGGPLPTVELVDLRGTTAKDSKGAFLTPVLLTNIREALSKQEQVVIFINRRGFDTFAQCRSCGHVFVCPNCDVSLTHHKKARALRCHLCGFSRAAPPLCPQCSGARLFFGGVGTQKVEEELSMHFPDARIERLDRDSTRKQDELERILDRFRNRQIDILTGTQMIVKGHDFPGISLVGILCGDLSLHFPDFRAGERTFQMLTQVAGRTGRASDSGRVILQTFDPHHAAIQHAAGHEYEAFLEKDSVARQELFYPPFGHLILLRIEGNNEKRVESRAAKIASAARLLKGESSELAVLGAAPCPRKKLVGKFRWQVLIKGRERGCVRDLAKALRAEGYLKGYGVKVVIDVDPIDLM